MSDDSCPKCGAPLLSESGDGADKTFRCGTIYCGGHCDSQSPACMRNGHRIAQLEAELESLKARAERAEGKHAEAVALLKKFEWVEGPCLQCCECEPQYECKECYAIQHNGDHADNCPMKAALNPE